MSWVARGWKGVPWFSPGWWGGRFSGGLGQQYDGFDVIYANVLRHLCLVAEDEAPDDMGGVLKLRIGGVNYAAFLVDTTDDYASNVHVLTTLGVKAVRLRTPITP